MSSPASDPITALSDPGPVASMQLGDGFADHVDARDPMQFVHTLCGHPLLQTEAIAQLAETLSTESITCEPAVKPLVVPVAAPEPERAANAARIIRSLDTSDAWMTLLNVEQHPTYRGLIDEQLDAIASRAGLRPADLTRRAGFIFASSPNSVTPAHFDIEHSLLIQLRGNRSLGFGSFADRDVRDREVRRYWNGSYGRLIAMPDPLSEVTLAPGVGVYIPPYTPHWLTNGDAPSLSLTITFFTRSNDTESLAQAFNERLRRLGLRPRRAGQSLRRDEAKAGVMRTYSALRGRFRATKPAPR